MRSITYTLLLLGLLCSGRVFADVMLLVHGYQAGASQWRETGVVQRLNAFQWRDNGIVFIDAYGQPQLTQKPARHAKKVLTAHLPSELPLLLQSQALERCVHKLTEAYPGERIVLVGHSAGGVIARAALVRASRRLPVAQLITIASPHLGTGAAELGVIASSTPLSWIASAVGADSVNRSEQLYHDLLPESPGTLLFLLNRQQHPRIEYVSVVRGETGGFSSDLIVPRTSQHMENVYALRGLARSVVAGTGHRLAAADADVIVRLVDGPRVL